MEIIVTDASEGCTTYIFGLPLVLLESNKSSQVWDHQSGDSHRRLGSDSVAHFVGDQ